MNRVAIQRRLLAAAGGRSSNETALTPSRTLPDRRRLGECLIDQGTVRKRQVHSALREQTQTGGRLGEILRSRGLVDGLELAVALAAHHDLPSLVPEYDAVPALDRGLAYAARAAVLVGPTAQSTTAAPVLVAVTDLRIVDDLTALLGRAVQPRLADEQRMDELLADAYAESDGRMAALALRRGVPRRLLRGLGLTGSLIAVAAFGVYSYLHTLTAICVAVALAAVYWLVMAHLAVRQSEQRGSAHSGVVTPNADAELPGQTILAPLHRESRRSLRRLGESLESLDYPRHKLQGLALLDPTDRMTRRSLRRQPLPPWITPLIVPRETAHGRRGSLLYGLLQTRGERVTVARADGALPPDALRRPMPAALDVPGEGRHHRYRRGLARRRLAGRFLGEADISWGNELVLAAGGRVRPKPVTFWTADLMSVFHWGADIDSPQGGRRR
jgi:hypothetical protein